MVLAFIALLLKGRLDRTTLLAMLFTIDGEQSFTGETAIAIVLEQATIREIARVFHQYVAHVFRAEQ